MWTLWEVFSHCTWLLWKCSDSDLRQGSWEFWGNHTVSQCQDHIQLFLFTLINDYNL